jgi:hypothetical protein
LQKILDIFGFLHSVDNNYKNNLSWLGAINAKSFVLVVMEAAVEVMEAEVMEAEAAVVGVAVVAAPAAIIVTEVGEWEG